MCIDNSHWTLFRKGEGIPYFLPPLSFSRFDSVQPNLFRKEQAKADGDNNVEDDGLIGKTRLRRIKHASYISFNLTDAIPNPPLTTAVATEYLKVKFITIEQFNAVKELFDKRPIMSKMVVSFETKVPNDKLKYILPILCYYYTTGPWRIMWVRFGYDPRKDFESRYFQQLDYRVRTHTGIKDHVSKMILNEYSVSQVNMKFHTDRSKEQHEYSENDEKGQPQSAGQHFRSSKKGWHHLLSILWERSTATVPAMYLSGKMLFLSGICCFIIRFVSSTVTLGCQRSKKCSTKFQLHCLVPRAVKSLAGCQQILMTNAVRSYRTSSVNWFQKTKKKTTNT